MGLVLALALTAPSVGVRTDGTGPCDSKSFARALATLRPELQIVPIDSAAQAPAGAWVARIEGLGFDQALLRVSGGPTPLQRPLPGDDCARALQTAASIVDGLLDQLPNPARGAESRRGASPRRTSLEGWLGAGILQGPIRWVPSFALGARFGLGSLEVVGLADIGLSATVPVATVDEGPGQVGSLQAIPFDLEAGVGWGPRLGPGRLSLDGLLGFALSAVTANATAPHLFDFHTQLAAAFFLGASAGYAFEVTARFFVGLRVEERRAVQQVNVSVDTAVAGDQVVTRLWTFTATGLVGWRFF